ARTQPVPWRPLRNARLPAELHRSLMLRIRVRPPELAILRSLAGRLRRQRLARSLGDPEPRDCAPARRAGRPADRAGAARLGRHDRRQPSAWREFSGGAVPAPSPQPGPSSDAVPCRDAEEPAASPAVVPCRDAAGAAVALAAAPCRDAAGAVPAPGPAPSSDAAPCR